MLGRYNNNLLVYKFNNKIKKGFPQVYSLLGECVWNVQNVYKMQDYVRAHFIVSIIKFSKSIVQEWIWMILNCAFVSAVWKLLQTMLSIVKYEEFASYTI